MSLAEVALEVPDAPATRRLGVAIIGCGLIGRRRAGVAAASPRTRVTVAADIDAARARGVAGVAASASGAAHADCVVAQEWRNVIRRDDVDIVGVATPNGLLADIAIAALEAGKHVLMEKPMGRTLREATDIAAAAQRAGRVLHVGFNHRHHPALRRAAELVAAGAIGRLINIRARYGHGGRPGLEHEWRSNPEQAGGGELLDQGVHLADLVHWIAGLPTEAYAITQTAVWPIAPLEDNAYGLLRFTSGVVAQLHVSMTQWRNLFSFELHGDAGALVVEGLGGSYGVERLTRIERATGGGAPLVAEERFEGEDRSWSREWELFLDAIDRGRSGDAGPPAGVAAMRIVDALYRSARSGRPEQV